NPDRTMTVVGIVGDARYRKVQTAYSLPSAVETGNSAVGQSGNQTWFVDTPTPITWSQVLTLNERGFVALSRAVYLNPPPKSQVPYYTSIARQHAQLPAQAIAIITLIGGMALLEVILLAGPAFAVGAR